MFDAGANPVVHILARRGRQSCFTDASGSDRRAGWGRSGQADGRKASPRACVCRHRRSDVPGHRPSPALPRGHRHRSKSDKFIMGVRQPVRPYQTMTKCVVSALKCRLPVDGGREIANVCQPPIDLRTQAARCSTAPAPSQRRRRGLRACRWLCRAPADSRVSTPCLFATGDCRPQRSVSGSPTSSDLAPRHRRARRGDASKA